MSEVRLSELIAPAFYSVHDAVLSRRYTHYWLKGGRGSCKSSFVSVEIILGMMKDPNANAVVIRKVGLYLKDSVFEQLLWAIGKLGVERFWSVKLSPVELIYIPTGQRVLFRGADKPRKLKSTKVSKGYIRYIWYEEADEFNGAEEIDTINQSVMRGGAKFDVFYSYNPPKSQQNWVNRYVPELKPDKYVHHSDYRSVPEAWLGPQFIIEANHLMKTKPQRYENEYLGAVTGTGAEVFNNLTIRRITGDERKGFCYIHRGLDWGYGIDPFVYLALEYDKKHRRIFIFHEYYKCGAVFDTIAAEIRKENTENKIIMAESAEPRSNDELRTRGLRLQAVKKGNGSVEHGITWLQNLEEIIIDPESCPETAREFQEYSLEPDGRGGYRDGFPDKNNHSIDAVRYALENAIGQRVVKISSKSKYGIC